MQSPNPEITEEGAFGAPVQSTFRVPWWIRIALFILHIVTVFGAASLTPEGYFFELGEYTGTLLIFGSIPLWWLLFSAKTRRGIFLFCVFVLAQAGMVALVGLHFRAEDRMLQPIVAEISAKRREWVGAMEPFRMDALFEMTSGKRELSLTELQELQSRARDGGTKLGELKSDIERFTADQERRLAAVDSRAARDFHLGVESSRQVSDEQMKLLQESLTKSEQLVVFLIDRYGQYAQTSKGLKFKKYEDALDFNNQLNAIASSQERLASINHRVELEYEKLPQ
jgi:hypothetical protein